MNDQTATSNSVGETPDVSSNEMLTESVSTVVGPPLWLLAELTYDCPLHCPYCSNPTQLTETKDELTTEQWCQVFTEARDMGAVQLGFSGGEPLLRKDLEVLVKHSRDLGFYTNLITCLLYTSDAADE